MNKLKGITVGTYLTKRSKTSNKKQKIKNIEIYNKCKNKDVCKYRKISKFENGKVFPNNVECKEFYFSISPKAILTVGRDTTTGKTLREYFTGDNEEEALNQALSRKIEIEKTNSLKVITKSNKSIIDLITNVLDEDYKLGKIRKSTRKRKMDTLKK